MSNIEGVYIRRKAVPTMDNQVKYEYQIEPYL